VLDAIISLVTGDNVQLLFDFNSLAFRDANGHWDPRANATGALDYLQSKYAGINIAWSKGNEPDLWPGTKYNASVLATDARILASTLKAYDLGRDVYGPSYAGLNPAQAGPFMAAAGPTVKGISLHDYLAALQRARGRQAARRRAARAACPHRQGRPH